jgi:hypothetical protein
LAGACAYTSASNYGYVNKVFIRVNTTGYQKTACGDFASGEWQDVFGHELGHALGLTHKQPKVTSIMRDGRWSSYEDKYYGKWIYGSNPL